MDLSVSALLQFIGFCYAVFLGCLLGLYFSVINRFVKKFYKKRVVQAVLDFLSFVPPCFVCFLFFMGVSNGSPRLYLLLGLGLGVICRCYIFGFSFKVPLKKKRAKSNR